MVMTVVMESCPVAKHDYSGCCEYIVLHDDVWAANIMSGAGVQLVCSFT